MDLADAQALAGRVSDEVTTFGRSIVRERDVGRSASPAPYS